MSLVLVDSDQTLQTYYALLVSAAETSSLLFDCIFYVQTMRLGSSRVIEKMFPSSWEQELCKRTFWFLYTVEKSFCLRMDVFPVCRRTNLRNVDY
jgi:hypothetical protein